MESPIQDGLQKHSLQGAEASFLCVIGSFLLRQGGIYWVGRIWPETATYFRDQLRQAIAVALQNAKVFQEILFVLERLGSYKSSKIKALGILHILRGLSTCFCPIKSSKCLFFESKHGSSWHLNRTKKATILGIVAEEYKITVKPKE